jgi:hypothetical protein
MDVGTIIEVIDKGLKIVSNLVEAGRNAQPAIQILLGLTQAQKDGKVTDEMLDDAEANLMAALEDFNKPMEPPQS